MNQKNIQCYIVFIILSITAQLKSQICEKTTQYGQCSTNNDCGCFHVLGANGDIGVCGSLLLTCSCLLPCNASDYSCSQSNTICVHHPYCSDRPLCYPTAMTHENYCPPMKNKINLKWKQNGITVAGGNGLGSESNQLFSPTGIFINDEKTIYIADTFNNRIVGWNSDSKDGQVITGEYGQENGNGEFNLPLNVVLDKQNNSLVICDSGNRRVMRWFHQNQIKPQILLSDIDCYGVATDKNGFIYISDYKKDEVIQWKEGDNYGKIVAGGNGKGDLLNQLNTPQDIFIDGDQSAYVADLHNHRVMKWEKDAKEGIVIAGGNGMGANFDQLWFPHGVIVDHLDQIYVVDMRNIRVMRWSIGKKEGEIVVGGNGQGNKSNQFSGPAGLSFDDEGSLYVVDRLNHRVQKFLIDI